ncbi:3-isopropylmalate dehydratase [Campylobacter majalis]|uniref:3-isopropylmalate dehydratase n=1 Tax=Campylobacter majalis TaxID=2790656 RepID=UPI003D68550D
MEVGYNIAFARLGQFLPFLHITTCVFFIGIQAGFSMIYRRFMQEDESKEYYERLVKTLGDFIYTLVICVILIAVTGTFVNEADSIKSADPMVKAILATKYTLSTFIAFNVSYMAYAYYKAKKYIANDDLIQCHENLLVIVKYFSPLNLIISLVAIYLGVAYRGF